MCPNNRQNLFDCQQTIWKRTAFVLEHKTSNYFTSNPPFSLYQSTSYVVAKDTIRTTTKTRALKQQPMIDRTIDHASVLHAGDALSRYSSSLRSGQARRVAEGNFPFEHARKYELNVGVRTDAGHAHWIDNFVVVVGGAVVAAFLGKNGVVQ